MEKLLDTGDVALRAGYDGLHQQDGIERLRGILGLRWRYLLIFTTEYRLQLLFETSQ